MPTAVFFDGPVAKYYSAIKCTIQPKSNEYHRFKFATSREGKKGTGAYCPRPTRSGGWPITLCLAKFASAPKQFDFRYFASRALRFQALAPQAVEQFGVVEGDGVVGYIAGALGGGPPTAAPKRSGLKTSVPYHAQIILYKRQ